MKTIRLKTAVMLAASCLSQPLTASNDACILTYNKKIWHSTPNKLTSRFSHFEWTKTKTGYLSSPEMEILLWDKQILSASVTGKSNTESIAFLLYDHAKSKNVSHTQFSKAAASWKSILDKKANKQGTALPKTRIAGKPATIIAWEFPDSIMTLTSVSSSIPNKLYIQIFSKSAGTAHLNQLKGSNKGKNGGAIKNNTILASLAGKTSYFSRRNYHLKDIAGNPEYFLLNFTASW